MNRVPMMRAIVLVAGVLLTGLLGCGGDRTGAGGTPATAGASDSAEAALKGMLAVAEAGDWVAYVSTYYGEAHKMTQPAEQTKAIAARLEKVGPKLIETLKGCLGQAPTLSDDGQVATYPSGFKLYRDDGRWGFHL